MQPTYVKRGARQDRRAPGPASQMQTWPGRPTPLPKAKASPWIGFFSPSSLTALVLLGWWVAQMVIALSHPDPYALTKEAVAVDASSSIEAGGLQNTLLVLVFAAVGGWHLIRFRSSRPSRAIRPLLALLGVYVAWSAASVLWSVDINLTIRRLAQMLLLIVGSVGLGLGLYGASDAGRRLFVKHLLVAGGIAMVTLWLSLASTGGADILDPAYSTKNLGLWTTAAHPIAYSVFAAVYLWHEDRMRGWQFAGFVAVWAVSLFVEKVRFITGYSLGLLLVLLGTRMSFKRVGLRLLPVALLLTLGLLALAALGTESIGPVVDQAMAYATLDQGGDNITGLSGRADLWSELQRYVAVRPELGYGFGAFWNPDHLQQIALALTWAPTVAHNGFLDEILATGIVGLAFNLAFWLAALGIALWRAVRDRSQFAWLATACVAMFVLLNWGDSVMQLYFRYPFYVGLAAIFALLGSAPGTVAQPVPAAEISRAAVFAKRRSDRRRLGAD